MTLSIESRDSGVGGPTSLLASSKRVIYHIFKWVSIVAVVAIFVSLLLGVVVRYVFSTNLGWVAEVPNLVFPWLTMCAIVAAAARNEHIGVELVVEKLPRLPKNLVVLAVNLIAMIAFSFMAVNGLDVVEIAGSQRLPITRIGMSWAYWSVVVGFMGLAVISFINIAMVLTGEINPLNLKFLTGRKGYDGPDAHWLCLVAVNGDAGWLLAGYKRMGGTIRFWPYAIQYGGYEDLSTDAKFPSAGDTLFYTLWWADDVRQARTEASEFSLHVGG